MQTETQTPEHDAAVTPMPEHFSDWNEQMVRRLDPEIFYHHPRSVVRWVESKRISAVLRHLDVRPKNRILDVGCGAGNILERFPANERFGLDLSPYMVRRAKERLGSEVSVIEGNAESLPFGNATFDRVIASGLLSHVLHPEAVIPELKRVTKPGGKIVISISIEESIEKGLRWVKELGLQKTFLGTSGQSQAYNIEYHLHHFTLKRLREVVVENLHEISLTKVPFVFPVHAIVAYHP
jgi:ubiquinone/menaquinone biosynthesis C-methylase UbiE